MKLTRIWLVRFARITMKRVNIFYSVKWVKSDEFLKKVGFVAGL